MAKAITIKLVPDKNTKIYKPQPNYADLYVLMNKLHINSVNEANDIEHQKVSELELETHKTIEEINNNNFEESSLNILQDSLEEVEKNIKMFQFNNSKELNVDPIKEFNNLINNLEKNTKNQLNKLNINKPELLLAEIQKNLRIIGTEKAKLNENTKNLSEKFSKLETLKENINSSITDIDTLEIAFKNIKY